MAKSEQNLLIISLALNGYQWIYSKNSLSHKHYASRHGFDYLRVERPLISGLGVECCWLKLPLALNAIRAGYNNVLIIDADTVIADHAPSILNELADGKHIYMAKGYSGEFNSGVMLMRGSSISETFIQNILNSHRGTLKINDPVGWGENAYIIQQCLDNDAIQTLSNTWNNTQDKNNDSFIIHANHGPNRPQPYLKLIHKLLARSTKAYMKLLKVCGVDMQQRFETTLKQESRLIANTYPDILLNTKTATHLNKQTEYSLKKRQSAF